METQAGVRSSVVQPSNLQSVSFRQSPVLVVENATLTESRRIALTLEELPEIARYGVTGPTLIMTGRVFAGALAASAQEALQKYARA